MHPLRRFPVNVEGERFEVRALTNGGGYVIVDTAWEHPMIGPYPLNKKGRERAMTRAAVFEADPSQVPQA